MKEVKLSKTEQELLNQLEIGKNSEIVKNPFSGEEFLLEPQAVALHDFIKGTEFLIAGGNNKLISSFDMARSLYSKLYPQSYYGLFD